VLQAGQKRWWHAIGPDLGHLGLVKGGTPAQERSGGDKDEKAKSHGENRASGHGIYGCAPQNESG
jgi:hypothetical protein